MLTHEFIYVLIVVDNKVKNILMPITVGTCNCIRYEQVASAIIIITEAKYVSSWISFFRYSIIAGILLGSSKSKEMAI